MAEVAVERMMDRVSIIFDCKEEGAAERFYYALASQILDTDGLYLKIKDGRIYIGEVVGGSID